MQRGSVFLCDVSQSGAAQSGARTSWDTKIGFVLLSPWSALTYSVLLRLVSGVVKVNKHLCAACSCACPLYISASVMQHTYTHTHKEKSSFSSLIVSLINCYIALFLDSHTHDIQSKLLTLNVLEKQKIIIIKKTPTPHILYTHLLRPYIFIYHKLYTNLLDSVTPPPIFCNLLHIFHVCDIFFQLVVVLAGRYGHQCLWPALCCDCLSEICINKLPVPACPRCCPGARTFAYRAVIGLPWVPSATAERVGGRQHHKWVLNWNLTAALHFMCVEARSKAESDQREKRKR